MEITAEKIEAWKITISGILIGEFKQTDSWNNFLELSTDSGMKMYVHDAKSGGVFDALFLIDLDGEKEFNVIAASPDIIAKLMRAKELTCPDCHGDGKIIGNDDCSKCKGHGHVGYSEKTVEGQICADCNGNGVVFNKKCGSCGGSGVIS